jgi:hypothetical protein
MADRLEDAERWISAAQVMRHRAYKTLQQRHETPEQYDAKRVTALGQIVSAMDLLRHAQQTLQGVQESLYTVPSDVGL